MATWILDTNIVIFLLARDKLLRDQRTAHIRLRLHQLDQALRNHTAAGGKLLLTPVVVQEALYILNRAYAYTPPECASRLMKFAQAPEVVCEDEDHVLSGLHHYGAHGLDFADGYLAARSLSDPHTYLITSDQDIGKHIPVRLARW